MAILLLMICFLLIFSTIRKFRCIDGWRSSFLFAALIWGLVLVVLTEFLSIFGWLSFWPIVGAWGGISQALLAVLVIFPGKNILPHKKPDLSFLSRFDILLLALLFLIVIMIGVLAWVAPPNTWDSMTYHMSRVIHWIQNKSVAFYPTDIERQLFSNPFSEFIILHLQILSGGDRFANFAQWFSMVGSIIGTSLLAKELKATPRGQIFAAIACATIPMGILQGSSTQTDYVCSFGLVCFVYFGLLFKRKAELIPILGSSIALGLSILAKATAYIIAFPFLVWFSLSFLINSHQKKKIWYMFIFILVVIAVNFGHYLRNYELYGSPLGQKQDRQEHPNKEFSIPIVASNIARNIGVHLGTPIKRGNAFFERAIVFFHHNVIGMSLNDERNTWRDTKFHVPSKFSYNEDTAGNLVHLLLIIFSIFIYLSRQNKEKDANNYVFSLIIAFLLFSTYLKWQPWISRLQLPLFVLWAPFIGLVFSVRNHKSVSMVFTMLLASSSNHDRVLTSNTVSIKNYQVVNTIFIMLLVGALPWLLKSTTKPVLRTATNIFTENRIDQYFVSQKNVLPLYRQAVQIISDSNCSNVGLITRGNSWEYPLWVLLHDEQPIDLTQISYSSVGNLSKNKYDKRCQDMAPCAIVMIDYDTPSSKIINGVTYIREWSLGSVAVLRPIIKIAANPLLGNVRQK